MSNCNRSRRHSVLIRMNDDEYKAFKAKLKKSGQTQQSYLTAAVNELKCLTPEEIEMLRWSNAQLADISRSIRGIGTNINQLAKYTNTEKSLPQQQILQNASNDIAKIKQEVNDSWQLLRRSMAIIRQKPDSKEL